MAAGHGGRTPDYARNSARAEASVVARRIRKIGVVAVNYTEGIANVVTHFKPKRGLEVGLREGISARAFLNNCEGTLVSVDHNDALNQAGILGDRHNFVQGDSSTVLRGLTEKFDYIYIDGDHSYEGAKADIEAAIPLLAPGGILLIDDYGVEGSSGGMTFTKDGEIVDGVYGVKKAADELLKGWEVLPFELGNGGKVYRRYDGRRKG